MQEAFYRPHKAVCSDGVTRTARVKSYWSYPGWAFYADTFFSVPAYVRVKGKTVRGYVSRNDGTLEFHAVNYGKNYGLLPNKPYRD